MASAPTLLIIDDEHLILEVLELGLSEAGYELVQAANGNEALAQLEADPARWGGVVTDIRLGNGPDGWRIGERARELNPTVQVVYISGDSGADWPSKGVPNSIMISKPFAIAQIVAAISGLLVQSGTSRSAGN